MVQLPARPFRLRDWRVPCNAEDDSSDASRLVCGLEKKKLNPEMRKSAPVGRGRPA